jgi:hypothetical protein
MKHERQKDILTTRILVSATNNTADTRIPDTVAAERELMKG